MGLDEDKTQDHELHQWQNSVTQADQCPEMVLPGLSQPQSREEID